ncbi:MAG: glutamine amidotransferase-related protein [Fluviicola sp.]
MPKDFLLVGVSDSCINEAMMHESKPLFGVQFHPEVSGNMGAILFQNFVQLCENHSNI